MSTKRIIPALILSLVLVSSCRDIYERLDEIETNVSNLQTIAEYIQSVIRESKIVREIVDNGDGYLISFTDGTSVTISNSGEGGPVESVVTEGNTLIITLSDGSVYVLPMYRAIPSSIALSTHEIFIPRNGTAILSFRVNPSNAVVTPEEISLDTKSKDFELVSIEPETDKNGKAIAGKFVATLRDLEQTEEFNSIASLFIKTIDAMGEEVEIWSDVFSVSAAVYKGVNTGLPIVSITTPGEVPIASKLEWIPDSKVVILNPDLTVDYEGPLSVKGRGNSTWSLFPKKPYAMKLDSKSKILGMSKGKRWCLLANYMDRTLIRNAVAFEISRQTGLAWTPSGRFVELFVNGNHLGNYYLCEQIRIDEKRVNLTDGYIFECDAWFDDEFKFKSEVNNVPWQFKDPDTVTQEEFESIQTLVNQFEHALFDSGKYEAHEYMDYIDVDSFIDFWLVNELAQNSEINQPKSAYIHMEKGGKFIAGPVWDFDWGTYLVRERYNYVSLGQKYYTYKMFQDKEFRKRVKQRWPLYKDKLYSEIPPFIDSLEAELELSDELNNKMWPINRTTNQDETLSFHEAVQKLKTAYMGKLEWLDTQIATY